MAGRAGRTYARDSRGRFASGGGGGGSKGGGKKAASARAANTARAAALRGKGTTALGGRLKAKGFSSRDAATRAGGLRAPMGSGIRTKATARASTVDTKMGGVKAGRQMARAAAAKKSQRQAGPGGKGGRNPARTAKAAPNAAKAKYKELTSRIRQGQRYGLSDSTSNRQAAGAKRSLNSMIAKRGRKR